jgi:hypothetical protein
VVSPGEFYGPAGADHVRIAVVQPDEQIDLVAWRFRARRMSPCRRAVVLSTPRRMQPGPFSPPPPPVVGARMVRPSRWWFVVAGLVAIADRRRRGHPGRWRWRLHRRHRGFRPGAPARHADVEITETGGYSIYHEYDGAYDGRLSSAPRSR